MHVNATELKNKLGKYLRICMRQDVIITKHGKDIAILKGIDDESFVRKNQAYDYSDPNHSLGKMTYSEFKDFTSKPMNAMSLLTAMFIFLHLLRLITSIHQQKYMCNFIIGSKERNASHIMLLSILR